MGDEIVVTAASCLSHPDTYTIDIKYTTGASETVPKDAATIIPGYDGANLDIGFIKVKNSCCIQYCCASCFPKDVVVGTAGLFVGGTNYPFPAAPCCATTITAFRKCQAVYNDKKQPSTALCQETAYDGMGGTGAPVFVGGNVVGFCTTSSNSRISKIFQFQSLDLYLNTNYFKCPYPPPVAQLPCTCPGDQTTTLKKSDCECFWTCDCVLKIEIISVILCIPVVKVCTMGTLVARNRGMMLGSVFPKCWDYILVYYTHNQDKSIPDPEKVDPENVIFCLRDAGSSVGYNAVVFEVVNTGRTPHCTLSIQSIDQCTDLRAVGIDAPEPYVSTIAVTSQPVSVCAGFYGDDINTNNVIDAGCVHSLTDPYPLPLGGGLFCNGYLVGQFMKTPTPNVGGKPAEVELPGKIKNFFLGKGIIVL